MGVGTGLYMYDNVVKMFTFAISSTNEFLCVKAGTGTDSIRLVNCLFNARNLCMLRLGELKIEEYNVMCTCLPWSCLKTTSNTLY